MFASFGILQVTLQLTVIGRLVDAMGNRVATNLGLGLCVLAFLLVPFATTFALAAVLLLLFGMGISVVNAAFPALASEVSPDDRRGTVLGVVSGPRQPGRLRHAARRDGRAGRLRRGAGGGDHHRPGRGRVRDGRSSKRGARPLTAA